MIIGDAVESENMVFGDAAADTPDAVKSENMIFGDAAPDTLE